MPKTVGSRTPNGDHDPLAERVAAIARTIPPEGVPRSAFVESALHDVDLGRVDSVLKSLHRRKVVWISRRGGAVRIFARQPDKGAIEGGLTATPIGRFVAAVAPHFIGLRSAERARAAAVRADDWIANGVASDTIAAHAHRILTLCRAHAERGLSVAAIREAMHETFAEDAVAAVVYHEPRLHPSASDDSLALAQGRRAKRAPRGLTADERMMRLIERAGAGGATRTDLSRALRPLLNYRELDAMVAGLIEAERVVAGAVRPQATGRPAVRYFAAAIGLPPVGPDGIALPRA